MQQTDFLQSTACGIPVCPPRLLIQRMAWIQPLHRLTFLFACITTQLASRRNNNQPITPPPQTARTSALHSGLGMGASPTCPDTRFCIPCKAAKLGAWPETRDSIPDLKRFTVAPTTPSARPALVSGVASRIFAAYSFVSFTPMRLLVYIHDAPAPATHKAVPAANAPKIDAALPLDAWKLFCARKISRFVIGRLSSSTTSMLFMKSLIVLYRPLIMSLCISAAALTPLTLLDDNGRGTCRMNSSSSFCALLGSYLGGRMVIGLSGRSSSLNFDMALAELTSARMSMLSCSFARVASTLLRAASSSPVPSKALRMCL
mmetsp:Transcript_52321/g.106665  ORF Transcript_52321/g.106665 Transcript_52321/m.106665 type:complete len:317 (+) Transcript_52321:60-1010(+)